jgi:SAM-dependent methyltransferase
VADPGSQAAPATTGGDDVDARLHGIAKTIVDAGLPEYDPWFYRYCGKFTEPEEAHKLVRHTRDMLELGGTDLRGARALDAGCGFGLTVVLMRLLGAEYAKGVDHSDRMIATVEAYLPLLPEDVRSGVEMVQGDIADLPDEDESFDVIICVEAISHFRSVERFLDEARRVLRPGGVLLVSDGNNRRNPRMRKHVNEVWEAFERGEPGQKVHGHLIERPFVLKRQDIIAEELPELSADQAREFAERTAAMSRDEIAAACRSYEQTGEMPSSRYQHGDLPLNPVGGVVERLFDPFEFGAEVERRGFDVKVRGHWGGSGGQPTVCAANRVLAAASRLTIPTASSFRIAARKR